MSLNGLTNACDLVTREVVGDDHIPGSQGGTEKLPDVGEEGRSVDGTVENQRGHHGVAA